MFVLPLQISQILSLEEKHQVKIKINQKGRSKSVRIQGNADDVATVMERILHIFRDVEKDLHIKSEGKLLSKQVYALNVCNFP